MHYYSLAVADPGIRACFVGQPKAQFPQQVAHRQALFDRSEQNYVTNSLGSRGRKVDLVRRLSSLNYIYHPTNFQEAKRTARVLSHLKGMEDRYLLIHYWSEHGRHSQAL